MRSLIQSLKLEIARVVRKELKEELLALRKASTAHRSEIVSLKRQVKSLSTELKTVARASQVSTNKVVPTTTPTPSTRFRFSAERFVALRAKFGITQAQMAKLLDASTLSVVKWESGSVQPREAQLQKIALVMKMGKRDMLLRLDET